MARRFTKFSIASIVFVLWVALTALYVSTYDKEFLQIIKVKSSSLFKPSTAAAKETINYDGIQLGIDEPIVIFPGDFNFDDVKTLYGEIFDDKSTAKILKYSKQNNPNAEEGQFHKLGLKTFNSFSTNTECNELENDIDIEVDRAITFDRNLEDILRRFISSNSDYFKEVYPYFEKSIPNHFARNTIDRHFFKLAGSSVWLEQYGVHFMISRIIYTPNSARNNPTVSLTYAQIFNEQWQEMKNVTLIVPTKSEVENPNTVKYKDGYFTKVSYPDFLPIPTLHKPSRVKGKNYGAEDPRILLIKDEQGLEQPLIVFNSLHRKLDSKATDDEGSEHVKVEYYRSMFVSWPWKFQRGKGSVDPFPNELTDKMIYNKMAELRRNGLERQKKQKNWAPFVDLKERETFTYDKFIYFIYRWSNLEVLRCELASIEGDESKCEFVYKMTENLDINEEVGPLRGGTELIDIGKFTDLPKEIKSNKQIWMGFARAHIKNCGCNSDMYRPNLVAVSKEGGNFNVDLISSFTSLDITPISWNLDAPQELCGGNSVIIPNGVSFWKITQTHETDSLEDELSITFSLSDATINLVRIRGILSSILNLSKSSKPQNKHIECALQESVNFCSDFSKEVSQNA